MLSERARAYSSSCLSPSILSQFTLLQPKIVKKSQPLFLVFKVNQGRQC